MKRTPLEQYQLDLRRACAEARIGDWFERYINKSRGLGNTHAIINACNQSRATVITATRDIAQNITDLHHVPAVAVLDGSFATTPARSVVDNSAILLLVQENRRIVRLAEQLLTLLEQKGIR